MLKNPKNKDIVNINEEFFKKNAPTKEIKVIIAIVWNSNTDFLYFWYFFNKYPADVPPIRPNITMDAPIILAPELFTPKDAPF